MNYQVASQSAERFIALPNRSTVSLLSIETHDGRTVNQDHQAGLTSVRDGYPLFTMTYSPERA